MALPYQAYNLIPNIVDGKQRMGDWDGTFVPDVDLPAPTNFRVTSYGSDFINYAWDYTDTQHKNFTLDMSVPPAGFTPHTTTISPEARTYQATATPNTYTGARIRATAPTAPDPVTDLSAVATGSTTVRLSWTAVAGADEYNIQRAPNNGLWSTIDATPATTYDDAGLTASNTYQYRIFTSNENGWGDVSNIAAIITDIPPVGGVTDLTKIRWHSSGASWDAISDGATMNGIDGMWSATSSEISSEVLLGGHKVAKDRLDIGGDYGFGFGRTIPDLPYGAEMWFRVWLWHPPAFDFSTDVNVRKTMRVRSKPTSTSLDVARINNKDAYPPNEIGAWYTAKENAWNGPDNGSWCLGRDGSQDFRTSQWDCLEVYTNSTTSDTEGRWKVWMNGVLVGEVTQKTLTDAGDVLQDCMYLSNWNDGVPQVQHYYWASPAIAVRYSGRDDTPHMATDANGFPFIGVAT